MARREAGLASLRQVVERRGRRRVAVRAGGVVVGVLAVVGAVIVMRGGTNGGPKVAENAPNLVAPEVAPMMATNAGTLVAPAGLKVPGVELVRTDARVMIAAVATDRGVLAELAPAGGCGVDRIDDEGLQRALKAAGEPAGIVRIGRRVMTEAELARAEQAGV